MIFSDTLARAVNHAATPTHHRVYMKELKTKKSAGGPRVKEKSDALQYAAKRMLQAGLLEKQIPRQRDT